MGMFLEDSGPKYHSKGRVVWTRSLICWVPGTVRTRDTQEPGKISQGLERPLGRGGRRLFFHSKIRKDAMNHKLGAT